jgi:hypothetical protein
MRLHATRASLVVATFIHRQVVLACLHALAPGLSPAKLRLLERNRRWTLLKLPDVQTRQHPQRGLAAR